jgi:hypothetical protein
MRAGERKSHRVRMGRVIRFRVGVKKMMMIVCTWMLRAGSGEGAAAVKINVPSAHCC